MSGFEPVLGAWPPEVPPEPQPPRISRWPTVLAWFVLLGSVGLIVVAGLRPRSPEPLAVEKDAPPAGPPTEFVIQARLAVGFHRLLGPQASGPMLAAVREAANTPADRLRAVTAVAAIKGSPKALERLNEFLKSDPPRDLQRDAETLQELYAPDADDLTPMHRDDLRARHGWFADLALTQHLPDHDPARRAALAPAARAAWTGLIMLSLGALALPTGAVLLVLVLVRWIDRGVRFAYVPPPPGRGGPFVEAFAVYLLGMVVVSGVISAVLGDVPLWANFLLVLSVPPAVLWPRLRGLSWPEVRAGFGLHPGRGLLREAGWGVVGYVAGLPLLAVAVVVTSVLTRVSGTTPSHPIAEQAAGGLPHALLLYALAAVYAPLVEELMFRGAFYHHVRARLPWWLSAIAVGVLFAAIHPQGWVGIPLLTTVALVFAALREWRGSIVAPMFAHACVNAVTVTMLVMMAG